MKKIHELLVLLPLMLALSACQLEENTVDPSSPLDSSICITIGGDTAVTKSSGQSIDLSEESGIDGLTISEEIASLDDLYVSTATKGTPIFTENLASVYGNIAVTPYDKTGKTWPSKSESDKNVTFKNNGVDVWSHNYAGNEFPTDGYGLLVFVKAPVDDAGRDNIKYNPSTGKISFDYESPTSSDSQDAVAQQDILFSSRQIKKANGDENAVLLYHALTGVKFKLGTPGKTNLNITAIDKVTFKNLRSAGQCVITPDYSGYDNDCNPGTDATASAPKSSSQAVWSFTGDFADVRGDFSQAFTATEAKGTRDFYTTGNYPESVDAASSKNNIMDAKATKTFMFIPQDLYGAGIDLIIDYQYKDGGMGPYKGQVVIKNFGEKMAKDATSYKWRAGELRTYTLTVGDRLTVDIDDAVDGASHKKSEVEIMNTGTAMAYMRVAVVGNWFYTPDESVENPVISITPCNNLTSHTKPGVINSKWLEGEDGYFYYLYPVPGGSTILPANTLFDEVTFSNEYGTGSKPYDDCELRVTLAVQAVRASQVTTAWGSALVKGQAKTIVSTLSETPID